MSMVVKHVVDGRPILKWRTNLSETAPYWEGWYKGLSELFISKTPKARLLVVANDGRLDTALIRAHMEGKYQYVVLGGAGHAIQEVLYKLMNV